MAGNIGLGIEVGVKIWEERDFLGRSYSMKGEVGRVRALELCSQSGGPLPATSAAPGARFVAHPWSAELEWPRVGRACLQDHLCWRAS